MRKSKKKTYRKKTYRKKTYRNLRRSKKRKSKHLNKRSKSGGVRDEKSSAAAIAHILNSTNNFYRMLKVPRTAPDDVIRKAYKGLSLLVHPDRCDLPRTEEAFKELNAAHETLSDLQERAFYDRNREQSPAATPTPSRWGPTPSRWGPTPSHSTAEYPLPTPSQPDPTRPYESARNAAARRQQRVDDQILVERRKEANALLHNTRKHLSKNIHCSYRAPESQRHGHGPERSCKDIRRPIDETKSFVGCSKYYFWTDSKNKNEPDGYSKIYQCNDANSDKHSDESPCKKPYHPYRVMATQCLQKEKTAILMEATARRIMATLLRDEAEAARKTMAGSRAPP